MYQHNDLIYEAVANLENIINIPIDIETSRAGYDAIITIRNMQFIVETKSTIRRSNQGVILSQLEDLRNNTNRPVIFIADYISKEGANHLKEQGLSYIDSAGNAFIKKGELFIYIDGQKRVPRLNTNQSRAFQEAGVKIIFALLYTARGIDQSYREIARIADVSIGSVSNVMNELEDLKYILKTQNGRFLKNQRELLERWMLAYNDVLRPRIFRKRMKFVYPEDRRDHIINNKFHANDKILWGGESAAAIIGTNLRPEKFTLYTSLEFSEISKALKIVPDVDGEIEILQKFWNDSRGLDHIQDNMDKGFSDIVPPLLIYTDLMNSGYGRNVEIANQIFKNELQHIQ